MTDELPCSQSSENNKVPILDVLRTWLAQSRMVLEVGSGTGQHAVHFAPALPRLIWQTTDLQSTHAGINAWISKCPSSNLRAPIVLDVQRGDWQEDVSQLAVDAVYCANTVHIMHWEVVCSLFEGVGRLLPAGGLLLLYGPFNYGGRHTSDSNRTFDASLRARDPDMGIRDLYALDALAADAELRMAGNQGMPANNRLLIWRR
jgi:SAM-dependent methyltransferase